MPKINLNPDLFETHAPHNGTDTSIEAADKITKLSRTKLDGGRLLFWIYSRFLNGATDREIEEHFQWKGNYERPRRWQLAEDGLILALKGDRRRNAEGNTMKVWTVTQAGIRVVTRGLIQSAKETKTGPI